MAAIRSLHRWLGLLLAVIVFSVAASGGLLLFRGAYYRGVYPVLAEPVTPAQAHARAAVLSAIESRWEGAGVRLVKFPRAGFNGFHVWLGDETQAIVHPVDGSVIDRWRWWERAPAILFELHAHLLAGASGKLLNGMAALILVLMSFSGLALWWPARRGTFATWKPLPRRATPGEFLRSHSIVGVAAALPVVLFAATGAAMVFHEPAAAALGRLLDDRSPEEPDAVVTPRAAAVLSRERILETVDRTFAEGETVFYYPGTAANARLMFRKRLPGEWHPNGRSYVLVDPYSGHVMQAIDAREQGRGSRLMQAVYPIHSAQVGGTVMIALAALAASGLAWLSAGGAWGYLIRSRSQRRRRLRKAA